MNDMLEKIKIDSKKDKLKELIKMLSEKMLEDDDSDLDYYKEKMSSPKESIVEIEMEEETPRLNEESEEKLLSDMGKHEEEEIEEGEERKNKDEMMLDEIRSFMKMEKSQKHPYSDKKSKRMMLDPTKVLQKTQKDFKSIPDDFDVMVSKKKKIKMK